MQASTCPFILKNIGFNERIKVEVNLFKYTYHIKINCNIHSQMKKNYVNIQNLVK